MCNTIPTFVRVNWSQRLSIMNVQQIESFVNTGMPQDDVMNNFHRRLHCSSSHADIGQDITLCLAESTYMYPASLLYHSHCRLCSTRTYSCNSNIVYFLKELMTGYYNRSLISEETSYTVARVIASTRIISQSKVEYCNTILRGQLCACFSCLSIVWWPFAREGNVQHYCGMRHAWRLFRWWFSRNVTYRCISGRRHFPSANWLYNKHESITWNKFWNATLCRNHTYLNAMY